MRVLFLNTWIAEKKEDLEKFIKEQAVSTDVFCLQEVPDQVKPFFENLLGDFTPFYASRENTIKDPDDIDPYNATYIRKTLAEHVSSYSVWGDIVGAGLDLCTKIEVNNTTINIANIHGQNRPGDKLDTPERLTQSKELIDRFTQLEGLKIMGGDFNLMPDTKAAKMFEESGYTNLIRKYDIKTTRNRLAWAQHPDDKRQYFADYVFCSPDVKIKEFDVIQNEVSDHLPMVLEFETNS